MGFSTHMHGRSFAGSGYRGNVGINIILPETNSSEDMRWHVQSVGRGRCNLGIAARRRQPQLGQLRLVATMDDVMCHARMVGFLRKDFFQYLDRLPTICKTAVVLRFRREQGQSVKSSCLTVAGISLIQLFHRRRVSDGPCVMVNRIGMIVKSTHRLDVVTLALGLRMQRLGLFHLRQTLRDSAGLRVIPKLMPKADGYAPVRHGTFGIVLCDLLKSLFCLLVPERVQ